MPRVYIVQKYIGMALSSKLSLSKSQDRASFLTLLSHSKEHVHLFLHIHSRPYLFYTSSISEAQNAITIRIQRRPLGYCSLSPAMGRSLEQSRSP